MNMPELVRILIPTAIAFIIGMAITPILTHYLYKYKAWKKTPGKTALDGSSAQEFNRLHLSNEGRAPRMGGIVVWLSVVITIVGIAIVTRFIPGAEILKLDFLSRSQTWIPLAALLIGAFAGLIDDILLIRTSVDGIQLRIRLLIVALLSCFIGWWVWR